MTRFIYTAEVLVNMQEGHLSERPCSPASLRC
jgi:hypothetical protein